MERYPRHELAERIAFEQIEPDGSHEWDLRVARIAYAAARPHLGKDSNVSLADFVPPRDVPDEVEG